MAASFRASSLGHLPFQAVDVTSLKKHGQELRWIRVDATGNSQVIAVDKFTMMRECCDFWLLDPLFFYPSKILGREKAIVVNLEQIRCIIKAGEVLLLDSLDSYVVQYVAKLQRQLQNLTVGGRDNLPFEFRALEVALETICTFLDSQAAELETEVHPLLDKLTSKISTSDSKRLLLLKGRLVELTQRVQKVRDEIEKLMDDDGDMAEMYLSRGSESVTESIKVLEMLLEAYFGMIDKTLNKLTLLKKYIDDTEGFIIIEQNNVRNQIIIYGLLLATATLVVTILGVIAAVFGMNFAIPLFNDPAAFMWVIIISGVSGVVVLGLFVCFFMYKRLLNL